MRMLAKLERDLASLAADPIALVDTLCSFADSMTESKWLASSMAVVICDVLPIAMFDAISVACRLYVGYCFVFNVPHLAG
jgi:hypothetical protein